MLRAQQSSQSSQRGTPSPLPPEIQQKARGQRGNVGSDSTLHRQATSPASTRGNSSAEQAASTAGSGGRPLSSALRAYFEPRFDWDFSKVRVHHDRAAASAAEGVQAKAYTFGSHIVFNAGQYVPHTPEGRRLLAHELAHVVQQAGGTGAAFKGPARTAIQRQEDTDAQETCSKRRPLYGYDNIRNLSRERLRAAGFVFCGPDHDMDPSRWERWVHPTRGVLHFQVRWRDEPQEPQPPPDDRQQRCADPCTSTTDDEDACKACCEEKIPEDDAACRRTCDVACSLMLMPVSGVSTPGDPLEREADQMASRVLDMSDPGAPSAAPPRPASSGGLQVMRDVPDAPAEPAIDSIRIYSFGPTGSGRMQKDDGLTVFSPPAPTDEKGRELARAGSQDAPIESRWGRYFLIDDKAHPYPTPVPTFGVRAISEWIPDDGSGGYRTEQADPAARYYGPQQPLAVNVPEVLWVPNDRPGVLTNAYVLNGSPLPAPLIMAHETHYVNDPRAPLGSSRPAPANAAPGKGAPVSPASPPSAGGGGDRGGDPRSNAGLGSAPGPRAAPAAPRLPPNDAARQIDQLAEAIKRTGDAATRDALVKTLRKWLASVQPLLPQADAQKMIDDAIRSLVKEGADTAIKEILRAITGASPSTTPSERNQLGPSVTPLEPPKLIMTPPIPIPDTPKLRPRFSYEYRNGPLGSYAPGAPIKFTLLPPEDFSKGGAKRLCIVKEADQNTPNPERFGLIRLESGSATPIELTAPNEPGRYVLRVDVGLGVDTSSLRAFEVRAASAK